MAASSRGISQRMSGAARGGVSARPMSIIGYFRPPAAIDVDEVSRERHFEDKTKHNAMLEVYRDDNEDWDEFEVTTRLIFVFLLFLFASFLDM